jgi:hypothetical protein
MLERLWGFKRDGEREVQPVEILTSEEFEAELDKKTMHLLGMTLSEFQARITTGDVPDTPAVTHLRFLAGV